MFYESFLHQSKHLLATFLSTHKHHYLRAVGELDASYQILLDFTHRLEHLYRRVDRDLYRDFTPAKGQDLFHSHPEWCNAFEEWLFDQMDITLGSYIEAQESGRELHGYLHQFNELIHIYTPLVYYQLLHAIDGHYRERVFPFLAQVIPQTDTQRWSQLYASYLYTQRLDATILLSLGDSAMLTVSARETLVRLIAIEDEISTCKNHADITDNRKE